MRTRLVPQNSLQTTYFYSELNRKENGHGTNSMYTLKKITVIFQRKMSLI